MHEKTGDEWLCRKKCNHVGETNTLHTLPTHPPQSNPNQALEFALKNADKDLVQRAIDTHANVNTTFSDSNGLEYTAMHIAAKMGCSDLINKLVKVRLVSSRHFRT